MRHLRRRKRKLLFFLIRSLKETPSVGTWKINRKGGQEMYAIAQSITIYITHNWSREKMTSGCDWEKCDKRWRSWHDHVSHGLKKISPILLSWCKRRVCKQWAEFVSQAGYRWVDYKLRVEKHGGKADREFRLELEDHLKIIWRTMIFQVDRKKGVLESFSWYNCWSHGVQKKNPQHWTWTLLWSTMPSIFPLTVHDQSLETRESYHEVAFRERILFWLWTKLSSGSRRKMPNGCFMQNKFCK